jgi:hypothetical protein
MVTRHRTQPSPTQRLTGPGELLQAVPYLLGFHPARSLVLVGLRDGNLVVTARLDLADAEEEGVLVHTISAMARGGSTSIVAAVFDEEATPGGSGADRPGSRIAEAIYDDAVRVGCEVVDTLLVAGGRWWSLTCESADCCPAEGRDVPDAPSAFTTAATYDGVVALPDRTALEALLDPLPDVKRAALDDLIEASEHEAVKLALDGHFRRYERSVKRAIFAAARESDEPGWVGLEDGEVARFGVALGGTAVRDAVWMAVDDHRLDGRELWRTLARRLPGPYDAPALFLFGWTSWRSGDGALAGIAAERAVISNPNYSAADLLLAALANGVDPRRLPKLRLPRSA